MAHVLRRYFSRDERRGLQIFVRVSDQSYGRGLLKSLNDGGAIELDRARRYFCKEKVGCAIWGDPDRACAISDQSEAVRARCKRRIGQGDFCPNGFGLRRAI